ncbi:hypothetical protein HPB50_003713 [Hyalomma asiaticum]|uniref:Uncharacterized protein n=1 Tax=Hyalomma asiaticum TaxID=266040 RepID=A0ACB7SUY9_HYAAI|nr:hypothetical protein HPB50_003713 [Hyalomma asiaticum]
MPTSSDSRESFLAVPAQLSVRCCASWDTSAAPPLPDLSGVFCNCTRPNSALTSDTSPSLPISTVPRLHWVTENHTINARKGATSDQLIFTMDDGADGEQTANIIYTNYNNCAVVDFPFKNRQKCSLWVKKDALHNTPQECFDQFEDNCDKAVARFDEETCKGLFDNL